MRWRDSKRPQSMTRILNSVEDRRSRDVKGPGVKGTLTKSTIKNKKKGKEHAYTIKDERQVTEA